MSNGDILTKVKRLDCKIVKDKNDSGFKKFYEAESYVTFRSKSVVISNGGT